MKRIVAIAAFILFIHSITNAQSVNKSSSLKKTHSKNASHKHNINGAALQLGTSYSSNSANNAYGPAGSRLVITDPIINRYNERANGFNVPISRSGVVGVPKGTYGFANGHLLLHSNAATSSGTITGTGAVGTGSTPGSMSTNAYGLGVNGKSPYAGADMWGTPLNGKIQTFTDSAVRVTVIKKDH